MWLWIVAALAAYFVKGLCGFANTPVFSAILGFSLDNIDISPVELLVGYPTNIILTIRNRKQLDAGIVLPLAVLVLAGSIPGVFLLKNINAQYIKIIFGFAIVLVGVELFLRDRNILRIKESKALLWLTGLISGMLCGLFGIGILLVAYVSRVTGSSREFKANINAVFTIENTFRIILYIASGVISLNCVKQALMLYPFMLIGLLSGIKVGDRINERNAKMLVILLLIISGIIQIISNL